jgi:uncharacterized membrane protein
MPFYRNKGAKNPLGGISAALFAVLAIAYPILVYVGREQVPFLVFVSIACLLLLSRAFFSPSDTMRVFRFPLLLAAIAIGALALIDAAIAAKAYPAVLSGIVAAVFANSLRHPPSLIERIARIRNPDLTVAARSYCRGVTWVWTLWLSANAVIATALGLWGTLGLWALWTGVISYLVLAALFVGEMMLRPAISRRMAAGRIP